MNTQRHHSDPQIVRQSALEHKVERLMKLSGFELACLSDAVNNAIWQYADSLMADEKTEH